MRILAFDIGQNHTGVAFFDSASGIVLPLATLHTTSSDELIREILHCAFERGTQSVILGMPLLPSGEPGKQARFVERIVASLASNGLEVTTCDERHTNPRQKALRRQFPGVDPSTIDGHAMAACELLGPYTTNLTK